MVDLGRSPRSVWYPELPAELENTLKEFTINFTAQGKKVKVAQGTDLLTAAIKAGIMVHAACGGEGICGKCKVSIDSKDLLACQTIVGSDLSVNVPKESFGVSTKLAHESEDFTKGIVLNRENAFKFSPLVRKVYIELSRPTQDDNLSDLDRICTNLSREFNNLHISTNLANLKHLSEVLRDSDFKVTATVAYKDDALDIITVEPGDTTKANYGFAFDIGTTTVAGQLIDLNNKNILGSRIAFNKQALYGSDVITRIIYASDPEGLDKLNESVLDNINEIIMDLCSAQKIALSDVYCIVCAGNMTMMHLLLKIDPANIRKAPYIPTTAVFETIHAPEAGIEMNPKAVAAFMPGVTTYIGGDIVSGVIACGLAESDELSLLIDIGTNGEIVLGNKDWMIGAAASAGPAFEGSGLECGMKAVKGAIQKAEIDKDLNAKVVTIDDGKPKGICGSGYIDLLCQMLKTGVIGKNGKMNGTKKTKNIRKTETGYEFIIAKDIVITEDDIENLKRSKGAIYSAIISLLNKVEKSIADVKKIYIAGGFGNYLNIENAIFIGLLPDADRSRYEFIGNSSLAGARMSLLSHDAFKKAYEVYKNITYVDLSSEPNYMDEYVASLFFPHTDQERFPSVQL
ncbi:MAG: ASKHA domain-containing protein [Candidatus Omnitrophota bacterium]|nr:ASKHA domain-containing protein [Candidatus Omnitrophota bacterium]